MDQEHHKEWRELESQAQALLRLGHSSAVRAETVFRLTILPSFTNCVSWELLRKPGKAITQPRETEYLISQTCWRRDLDSQKLQSPLERLQHPKQLSPTMEQTNLPVHQWRAKRWIEQFASVRVPVVMAGRLGLDGTAYEFSLGDSFGGLTVTWWEQAPTVWREFEDKFNLVRGEIEGLFRNA